MSTNTDAVDAILADTVSRQKNTALAPYRKSLKQFCTVSPRKRTPIYESSNNSRKPSSKQSQFHNTTEERTDADNRLREFILGLRSTEIDGKEHWYDASQGRPYTLQEIAEIMGVSRERVRQVEEQALKKMWRYLSAMTKREHLKPDDWLRIANDKDGDESTIYMS